jgi:hypothetical protein
MTGCPVLCSICVGLQSMNCALIAVDTVTGFNSHQFVVVNVTDPEVPAAEVFVDAVIWTAYVYAIVGTAS